MNLGERVTYCGFKWIFLHGSVPIQTLPNPFDGRTRFEMDTSHIFPQGVLAAITLVGGGAGDGGGQSAHSTWAGTHTSAEAVAGNPVASVWGTFLWCCLIWKMDWRKEEEETRRPSMSPLALRWPIAARGIFLK